MRPCLNFHTASKTFPSEVCDKVAEGRCTDEEGLGRVCRDTSIGSEYCGDLLVVGFKLSRERTPYHVSISLGEELPGV